MARAWGSSFHSASTITRFCRHLGGVAGLDGHGFLQKDRPAVALLVDQMHGGTGQLYAPGQGGFVNFQPVEALGRKSWGSGWDAR